jgi:hypothetical protein
MEAKRFRVIVNAEPTEAVLVGTVAQCERTVEVLRERFGIWLGAEVLLCEQAAQSARTMRAEIDDDREEGDE